MAKNDEALQKALKDSLERKGVLGEMKARLRSELYHAMDDCSDLRQLANKSKDTIFINELIREYLLFNNYKFTVSVFESEAGLSEAPIERTLLAAEINEELPEHKPLLESIVKHHMANPNM